MNNYAICINTFIKPKDTQSLLNSLENCIGSKKYNLYISLDSINNMPYNKAEWIGLHKETANYLINYASTKNVFFNNIELVIFNKNYGPYKSCKRIIDIGMQNSDYIIFLEDDCVLSKDFLMYHEYMYENFAKQNPSVYTIASSLMYWPKDYSFEDSKINKVNKAEWVPSFEFGITKSVWEKFGSLRGQPPEGDVCFGQSCKDQGMHSLYPLIPRCYRNTYQENSHSAYYAPQKFTEESIPKLSNCDTKIDFNLL
jgi:hypothetical protein